MSAWATVKVRGGAIRFKDVTSMITSAELFLVLGSLCHLSQQWRTSVPQAHVGAAVHAIELVDMQRGKDLD
jgi:hypothetical protein